MSDLFNEFDELFRRISSSQSRKVSDLLFTATAEDLASTYQPGKTETVGPPATLTVIANLRSYTEDNVND